MHELLAVVLEVIQLSIDDVKEYVNLHLNSLDCLLLHLQLLEDVFYLGRHLVLQLLHVLAPHAHLPFVIIIDSCIILEYIVNVTFYLVPHLADLIINSHVNSLLEVSECLYD
jgi:hypothetical protein